MVVPIGRRNWLFTWTELGAERVDADGHPAKKSSFAPPLYC